VNLRTRYTAGLAVLAAVATPVALHEAGAGATCNPSTTICDPDNPAAGRGPTLPALPGTWSDADPPANPLGDIRAATRRFRRVDAAIDAGYVQFFGCVHEPLAGAMGIHFVNGELAGDTVLNARRPEALTYEIEANGELSLVGVEYVVFKEAWDAEHAAPPSLFDQHFVEVPADNRFAIPAFYALHAWAWKSNPAGDFEDWNPRVICTTTEGHVHGS
jgi:hypothetical protein